VDVGSGWRGLQRSAGGKTLGDESRACDPTLHTHHVLQAAAGRPQRLTSTTYCHPRRYIITIIIIIIVVISVL